MIRQIIRRLLLPLLLLLALAAPAVADPEADFQAGMGAAAARDYAAALPGWRPQSPPTPKTCATSASTG